MNTSIQNQPKRLSLEQTIELLNSKKGDLLTEFFPPQLMVRNDKVMEFYKIDYHHRPIMFEMYFSMSGEYK